MGCECSQQRDEIIALLGKLGITSPKGFGGVGSLLGNDHKPCPHCSKYIYQHLKKELAKKALSKGRPKNKALEKEGVESGRNKPNSDSAALAKRPSRPLELPAASSGSEEEVESVDSLIATPRETAKPKKSQGTVVLSLEHSLPLPKFDLARKKKKQSKLQHLSGTAMQHWPGMELCPQKMPTADGHFLFGWTLPTYYWMGQQQQWHCYCSTEL